MAMMTNVNSVGIPTEGNLKDPWAGDMPPHNTPYWVIVKYRGASFLRGWIQVDKTSDYSGFSRRMRHYEKVKKDMSHIWR